MNMRNSPIRTLYSLCMYLLSTCLTIIYCFLFVVQSPKDRASPSRRLTHQATYTYHHPHTHKIQNKRKNNFSLSFSRSDCQRTITLTTHMVHSPGPKSVVSRFKRKNDESHTDKNGTSISSAHIMRGIFHAGVEEGNH